MLKRIGSALRYLKMARAAWRWRILPGTCPACESRWFISLQRTGFMTRCARCRATLLNLGTLAVVRRHFGDDYRGKHAYELSSYGATFSFLQRRFEQFTFSEFMPGRAFGEVFDGVRNEDVQRLTFADNSFDVVTSNQVLEHVPDDLLAFRECHRVLVPGGALIFTVPLYDTPSSVQLARLDANGAIEWIGTPEYHDSRLGGPRSAPAFWRHSQNDIADRVKSAGFKSAAVEAVEMARGVPVQVVYAVK
jgi:SAM-dependent methyltransferase